MARDVLDNQSLVFDVYRPIRTLETTVTLLKAGVPANIALEQKPHSGITYTRIYFPTLEKQINSHAREACLMLCKGKPHGSVTVCRFCKQPGTAGGEKKDDFHLLSAAYHLAHDCAGLKRHPGKELLLAALEVADYDELLAAIHPTYIHHYAPPPPPARTSTVTTGGASDQARSRDSRSPELSREGPSRPRNSPSFPSRERPHSPSTPSNAGIRDVALPDESSRSSIEPDDSGFDADDGTIQGHAELEEVGRIDKLVTTTMDRLRDELSACTSENGNGIGNVEKREELIQSLSRLVNKLKGSEIPGSWTATRAFRGEKVQEMKAIMEELKHPAMHTNDKDSNGSVTFNPYEEDSD